MKKTAWHIKESYGYATPVLCGRKAGIKWTGEHEMQRLAQSLPKPPIVVPNSHYCNDCAKKFNERVKA